MDREALALVQDRRRSAARFLQADLQSSKARSTNEWTERTDDSSHRAVCRDYTQPVRSAREFHGLRTALARPAIRYWGCRTRRQARAESKTACRRRSPNPVPGVKRIQKLRDVLQPLFI